MTILVAGASESVGDQQIFFFLVGPKYLTETQKILSSHRDPLDRQELIQPSFLNFHIQHFGLTMWSSYR